MLTLQLILLWSLIGYLYNDYLVKKDKMGKINDTIFCFIICVSGPFIWIAFIYAVLITLNQDRKRRKNVKKSR